MQKRNRSNILGFLFGLFVLLLGLGAWGLGGQINRLTCTRLKTAETECRLERRFFGLLLLREQRLQGVSGAALREDCQDGCRYWVELLTETGSVRLTYFSSYNRPGVQADQQYLAEQITNPNLISFEFTSRPSWILFVSGLPLVGIGGWLANDSRKHLFAR